MKAIENTNYSKYENIREILSYALVIVLTVPIIIIAIIYTPKVNSYTYRKIDSGMDMSEVIDILGKKYERVESFTFLDNNCVVLRWINLVETKYIAVSFVNDKVVAKAKGSLKNKSTREGVTIRDYKKSINLMGTPASGERLGVVKLRAFRYVK